MANTRLLFASTVSLCLSLSCEVGPQGTTGPPGPAGSSPGSSPDCPDGYVRDNISTTIIICQEGVDEVVKVGTKGSAFWIDRYEASIWQNADGTGQQYGSGSYDYPITFPKNGQVSVSLYALSKIGIQPSQFMSWFQANEACRASGKRLPTSDEWLAAARGTLDPGDSPGTSGACVTNAAGPRSTGAGTKCVSDWGAQDMIGNLTEWVAEWHVGVGQGTDNSQPWPSGFGNDTVFNVSSAAFSDSGAMATKGIPSALNRGGEYTRGVLAGIFTMDLSASPNTAEGRRGVRCVIPR